MISSLGFLTLSKKELYTMKRMLIIALLVIAVPFFAFAQKVDNPASTETGGQHQTFTDSSMQPMFIKFKDVKWEKIIPELGDSSPEIAFLRVDAKTKATQLMIRVPKNFHVPRHWHTANETHTILSGTLIMECEGKREELGPGSFNYMPSKMIHQAWTKPDEGMVVFITVDGAWDQNWVDGPPQAPKKQ
jgi:mannose-6-phosphate isomerase-like protein (cupin superfamily)